VLIKHLFFVLLITFIGDLSPLKSQSYKPIYVIVHGAWGGGWAFKKVDSLLTEKGCIVYRPTLTGQGEKVHLASKNIGLEVHINDVLNMILYEDIKDIVLVGHSYGGMVVTGVADRVPKRIKRLIYLDAFVPENGESASDFWGQGNNNIDRQAEDGFLIPRWVPEGKSAPKDVPHSLKTLTDHIVLTNSARDDIVTSYILTVEKGKSQYEDGFAYHAKRAEKKGWSVTVFEADHNPQWSSPEALVELLWQEISKN
jgi:pimeloyl-ACP methyl ester carboxylesterase